MSHPKIGESCAEFAERTELAQCDAEFAKLFGANPEHRKLDQKTKREVWNAFRSGWLAALLSREGERSK